MILEIALLDIKPGQTAAFEAAFAEAEQYIRAIEGYRGHELRRCLENDHRYALLVHWRHLEDHTITFRHSPAYQHWKALLHHFYSPFPVVEHYELP